MTALEGMTPDAIRARFVAFLVVIGVSFALVAFFLARQLRRRALLRRRSASLPEAVRRLALEELEVLLRIGGRDGAAALFAAIDSPTSFDRAFTTLLRDGVARSAISLVDAERLLGVRVALGHARAPAYREPESTRDLDPQRMVLLRSRPAIVAEVRENGVLLIELGRRRHPIERGRRFRLSFEGESPAPDGSSARAAEVTVLDSANGLALVAHAPFSAAPSPGEPEVLA